MTYSIDKDELMAKANQYCDYCIESTKEVPTAKGACTIKERHLPTIRYFLHHWLRREHFEFYKKSQFYAVMKDSEHPLSDTIKEIDEHFNALATDIVANEGKGIFYAKNKLGMTDKQDIKQEMQITGLETEVIKSPIPLAGKESEIIQ